MKTANQQTCIKICEDVRSICMSDKYNKSVFDITLKLHDTFINRSIILDIGEVQDLNDRSLLSYWTPISFTRYPITKRTIDAKIALTRHVYEDFHKYCSNDRLTCIGNGCLDQDQIMIVGMTAGFRGANKFDELSFPYKFSFYFGETSFLLREGFFDLLDRIYFTNIGKYSYTRDIMKSDDTYNKTYEDCFSILQTEIEVLKPKLIIAAGNDVHQFLNSKGIKSYKIIHPSYYLFKKKIDDGKKYYTQQAKYIRNEMI